MASALCEALGSSLYFTPLGFRKDAWNQRIKYLIVLNLVSSPSFSSPCQLLVCQGWNKGSDGTVVTGSSGMYVFHRLIRDNVGVYFAWNNADSSWLEPCYIDGQGVVVHNWDCSGKVWNVCKSWKCHLNRKLLSIWDWLSDVLSQWLAGHLAQSCALVPSRLWQCWTTSTARSRGQQQKEIVKLNLCWWYGPEIKLLDRSGSVVLSLPPLVH